MLYALATLVRGERWQRLLEDEGATPHAQGHACLNVIGYMGNNVLPARAGDAIRVFLMAPAREHLQAHRRRHAGRRAPARRRVLLVIFVIVGYGLLGEVGGDSVELIALVAIVGVSRARRRLALRPPATRSSTASSRRSPAPRSACARAHHGLRLLGMTLMIWAIETGVWMSTAASVGFLMNPIEGLYMVALASVFAMIPSGPGYAGTQDAAVAIGVKALGGTRRAPRSDIC